MRSNLSLIMALLVLKNTSEAQNNMPSVCCVSVEGRSGKKTSNSGSTRLCRLTVMGFRMQLEVVN
jgi:hypothetical protein